MKKIMSLALFFLCAISMYAQNFLTIQATVENGGWSQLTVWNEDRSASVTMDVTTSQYVRPIVKKNGRVKRATHLTSGYLKSAYVKTFEFEVLNNNVYFSIGTQTVEFTVVGKPVLTKNTETFRVITDKREYFLNIIAEWTKQYDLLERFTVESFHTQLFPSAIQIEFESQEQFESFWQETKTWKYDTATQQIIIAKNSVVWGSGAYEGTYLVPVTFPWNGRQCFLIKVAVDGNWPEFVLVTFHKDGGVRCYRSLWTYGKQFIQPVNVPMDLIMADRLALSFYVKHDWVHRIAVRRVSDSITSIYWTGYLGYDPDTKKFGRVERYDPDGKYYTADEYINYFGPVLSVNVSNVSIEDRDTAIVLIPGQKAGVFWDGQSWPNRHQVGINSLYCSAHHAVRFWRSGKFIQSEDVVSAQRELTGIFKGHSVLYDAWTESLYLLKDSDEDVIENRVYVDQENGQLWLYKMKWETNVKKGRVSMVWNEDVARFQPFDLRNGKWGHFVVEDINFYDFDANVLKSIPNVFDD